MLVRRVAYHVVLATLQVTVAARSTLAQRQADPSLLTVERIYSGEFRGRGFGPSRWLDDSTYTVVEASARGNGTDIVRVDAASGRKTVLVAADRLTPKGQTEPLEVEDYQWSDDG